MPVFNKSTVNIGIRQKGREFSKSIISTEIDKTKITKAIKKQFLKISKKLIKMHYILTENMVRHN